MKLQILKRGRLFTRAKAFTYKYFYTTKRRMGKESNKPNTSPHSVPNRIVPAPAGVVVVVVVPGVPEVAIVVIGV